MICPNCGKEYNERMTCCISCGADLVPLEDSGQTALEQQPPDVPGFIREVPGHSPSPVPEPEPEEIPVKTERIAGSAVRAGRRLCSLAVWAVMLAFLLLFSASAAVRLATSEKFISGFAEDLDVLSLPAAEAAVPTEGYDVADDATVQEAVYVMSRGTGLSREDIRTVYESSTIRDFITAELRSYADFVRTGSIPEKITADKLKGVFSENIGVISDTMGIPLSQHDINLAFTQIEKLEPVLEKLSPSALEDTLGAGGMTALRLLSSVPALILSAAFAIAALLLLKAINKSSAAMLRWGGAAALSGGAVTALAVFLPTLLSKDTLAGAALACAAETLSPELYGIAAFMALAGVIMLLAAKLIKN